MLARKLELHNLRVYKNSLPRGLILLPPLPSAPDDQVKAEEGRHVCNRSQNGVEESAGPKRPVSVAQRKKHLVVR